MLCACVGNTATGGDHVAPQLALHVHVERDRLRLPDVVVERPRRQHRRAAVDGCARERRVRHGDVDGLAGGRQGRGAVQSHVVDGRIVAAAQEERFSRKKHDPGFPTAAVAYCLCEAGLKPEYHEFNMAHQIIPESLEVVRDFIVRLVPPAPAS